MPADTPWRKKLIEVAIPLDAINRESAREKSIRHGHPSTLHLWWARRPLAACRAVIFCSLIDDPGEEGAPAELLRQIDELEEPRPLPADWDAMDTAEQRRQKLFKFIETLVKWESTTDEDVIGTARKLILAATEGNPPPLLDPFCGGGSIPLEAQRLGLEAHGSDLNPVAVLITKALIELPPKFAGMPPVNPDARGKLGSDAEWKGAAGLAEDVRWYGEWMRQRAWERIGHLYPEGPNGETVIAWLWARTVKCPNPACGMEMPLISSFWLSKKQNREAWLEPEVDHNQKAAQFHVRRGKPPDPTAVTAGYKVGQATFRCAVCEVTVKGDYIDDIANTTGLGVRPLAVVTETETRTGRNYADDSHMNGDGLQHELSQLMRDRPDITAAIPHEPSRGTFGSNAQGRRYGFHTFGDYFTQRQLVALATFSGLVAEARDLARHHATASEHHASVSNPDSYAEAVATYLAFVVGRCTNYWSSVCRWQNTADFVGGVFARQGISMIWDFAEANPFSRSTGNWLGATEWVAKCLSTLPLNASEGHVSQGDSSAVIAGVHDTAIATDPPYYDNVTYSDLSDWFYVWLRRIVGQTYPNVCSTVLTPKAQELIVERYRSGGDRHQSEQDFEDGLAQAFSLMHKRSGAGTPTTLFYAYKQEERRDAETRAISAGWDTMLTALIASGFAITGTWPMRTELSNRPVASGRNALATSVVLVCRPRSDDAPMADIGEFNRALASELPATLNRFIGEHIAPVDLPQASIGPGMAVFSRYSAVVLPNGERMSVRRALELINEGVEQFFSEREGAFDAPTQFCLRWFEQFGFEDGPFGDADNMARAKDISVEELDREGVLTAQRGKVRLIPFERYEASWESWDPAQERRLSAWRVCHYLAAALEHGGVFGRQGDHDAGGAARLARELGGNGEQAKELAYRLYAICDAKGWTQEARRYNALADAWPEISAEAARLRQAQQGQLGVI